jgi:hypothetical protein
LVAAAVIVTWLSSIWRPSVAENTSSGMVAVEP